MEKRPLPTALYCRLSREDGDRMEIPSETSEAAGGVSKIILSW